MGDFCILIFAYLHFVQNNNTFIIRKWGFKKGNRSKLL